MSHLLNNEKGRCQGTACLAVRPVKAVVELGAGQDVVNPVLKAAHQVNRHGSIDDFIAVSFPSMYRSRTGMSSGYEIELYGSEQSLAAFLELEESMMLVRRGMVVQPTIEEAYFDEGMEGTAFIRDRLHEKSTAGWARRAKARAARRGKHWVEKKFSHQQNSSVLSLHYGSKVINIRQQTGFISDKPMLVSTYGFSSSNADGAVVLPVVQMQKVDLAHAV